MKGAQGRKGVQRREQGEKAQGREEEMEAACPLLSPTSAPFQPHLSCPLSLLPFLSLPVLPFSIPPVPLLLSHSFSLLPLLQRRRELLSQPSPATARAAPVAGAAPALSPPGGCTLPLIPKPSQGRAAAGAAHSSAGILPIPSSPSSPPTLPWMSGFQHTLLLPDGPTP